jgi:hypothetical protein
VAQVAAAGFGEPDQAPSTSRQHILASAPNVQPPDSEDIPMKVIHIGADAT